MGRKLKVYQTSLGFFDQAIAAPSMKAALEAWGADSNLFHQGAAKESYDPDVVAATMAKPGVVLRRPVGSSGRFTEHAALPTDLGNDKAGRKPQGRAPKPCAKKRASSPNHLSGNGTRGSHHGLAATAAHLQEAGYICADCIVLIKRPCTGGAGHTFCPRRSLSAALSSMASASKRFSFVFSSSSDRSRLASETSIPPNLAFHL